MGFFRIALNLMYSYFALLFYCMRTLFTLLGLIYFVFNTEAQVIRGKVVGTDGQPYRNITVALYEMPDSFQVKKYTITDPQGKFQFPVSAGRTYRIQLSGKQVETKFIEAINVDTKDIDLPSTTLTNMTNTLQEVQVIANRPPIEVKSDKVVMNVDGTMNAVGNDALEILRKSPGITVDKDGNITMMGKNGIMVYVDGRRIPMSGEDLASYLKSIPGSQLNTIEVISQPSSKYDASGNAGVINIKFKKNKTFGTNLGLQAGYAVGVYPKYHGDINFNHRNKKLNVFGGVNAQRNKNWVWMSYHRTLLDSIFYQQTDIANNTNNVNFRLGTDYFINDKNVIGILFSANLTDLKVQNDNYTDIISQPNTLEKYLVAKSRSEHNRYHYSTNVNYRHADTAGREWNVDFDYGKYDFTNEQYQPNIYYDDTRQNEIGSIFYKMNVSNQIELYSLKSDLEMRLGKGKIHMGAKGAFVNADNDFYRYEEKQQQWEFDTTRANGFDYNERILAGYLELVQPIKHWTIQAGLRAEHTEAKGTSFGYDMPGVESQSRLKFTKSYFDLFPNIGFNYKKNPAKQLFLKYSRRIDRPVYQDLNPFEFKFDDYTFSKGNINLRPQYTDVVSLSYLYKHRLNISLSYSHVKDMFTQIIDTIDISKSFITKENLGLQKVWGLQVNYPYNGKKYGFFVNLNGQYVQYEANFGEGKEINQDVFTFQAQLQQHYKLNANWTIEMTGWMTTPYIFQGIFKSNSMGMVDMGLSYAFMNNSAKLRLAVTDIFNTMNWKAVSDYSAQINTARALLETQQVKLNFSIQLGNKNLNAFRLRKIGIEEENKRVQTNASMGQ